MKQTGQAAIEAAWPGKTFDVRYFFGAAGAFVGAGEDWSPPSLQATKNVAQIKAKNR